jgi:hypothetical protein
MTDSTLLHRLFRTRRRLDNCLYWMQRASDALKYQRRIIEGLEALNRGQQKHIADLRAQIATAKPKRDQSGRFQ